MVDTVGKRIKQAIKDSGLRVSDVSKKLDQSPQAVYAWIRTGRISKDNLVRLAALTGVSTDWIVSGDTYFKVRSTGPSIKQSNSNLKNEITNTGMRVQVAPDQVRSLIMTLLDLCEEDETHAIEISETLSILASKLK